MSQDQRDIDGERETAGGQDGHSSGVTAEAGALVRHRQHRFPARDRVVKARYDQSEYTALVQAAARAGLTASGFLALAGLAAAGQGPLHRSPRTGSCWPSCCTCGRRFAGTR